MKYPRLSAVSLMIGGALMIQATLPSLSPIQAVHAQSTPSAATLTSAQLQSLVSPIALYPDSLLSQVLMASTYPLEVAEAANWLTDHKGQSSEQLQDAMKPETWDNSVKSLVMVPDVLQMMSGKLSWTQQLGDAYLAQPKDVMSAVQVLRKKAQKAGNLQSDNQIKVSTQQSYVVIQPSNPEVIYVPQYNPTIVYGNWAYPAYPPPPVYNPAWGLMSFGVGMAVGAALWSTPHWGTGSITINNNSFNSFNRNVNTSINRQAERLSSNSDWRYNPAHRGNVPYNNPALSNRYGDISRQDAISRNQAQRYQDRADNWTRNATPEQQARRQQARDRASQEFSQHDAGAYDRARQAERIESAPRLEGGGFRRR